jgi:hypothetical protein
MPAIYQRLKTNACVVTFESTSNRWQSSAARKVNVARGLAADYAGKLFVCVKEQRSRTWAVLRKSELQDSRRLVNGCQLAKSNEEKQRQPGSMSSARMNQRFWVSCAEAFGTTPSVTEGL